MRKTQKVKCAKRQRVNVGETEMFTDQAGGRNNMRNEGKMEKEKRP